MYHYEKMLVERQKVPHGAVEYFIRGPAAWANKEAQALLNRWPPAGYGTRIVRDELNGHNALIEIIRGESAE